MQKSILLILLYLLGALPMQSQAARVVVISDLNGGYGSTDYRQSVMDAVQRIGELNADLVISTGDMVGAQRPNPLLNLYQLNAMWHSFDKTVVQPLAQLNLPFAVTPGNHDASSYGRYRLEREVFRDFWLARKPALHYLDDAHYPLRYAYSLDDVLFISLDATRPGKLDEKQYLWLQQLLEKHAANYSHKIVYGHLPLWPFAQQREMESLFDTRLESLLITYKTDLFLSGHHHAYYPGAKDDMRHVGQGCLGASPRSLIGVKQRSPRTITVLDIEPGNEIKVSAYQGKTFNEPVDLNSLPKQIKSHAATLVREDLAGY